MMDRRGFLRSLGLSALTAAGCGRASGPLADAREAAVPVPTPASPGDPLASGSPRVVVVRSEAWKSEVEVASLRGGLAAGITALTGAASAADGWRGLFGPRENVAIKVNCLGGPGLQSSPALARAFVDEMVAAGHEPGRLWVYDRSSAELVEVGYDLCDQEAEPKCLGTDEVGYEEEVTVTGEVGTWFSLIVRQWADALVNVPVAKDHDLSGLSGALKNHFGSISNPNKLHFPDISRAIADVAAAEPIAGKQRLIVYDALRICYDGGPAFKPATTVSYGGVLLATDPVAADTVVLGLLDALRAAAGLKPLAEGPAPPLHLAIAADEAHAVGCADGDRISVVEVKV